MNCIKLYILTTITICGAYASENNQRSVNEYIFAPFPVVQALNIKQLKTNLDESLQPFIGKDGLFSDKYFKTIHEDNEKFDIAEESSENMTIDEFAQYISEKYHFVLSTIKKINRSHSCIKSITENSFSNIQIYDGKTSIFYSNDKRAFEEWQYLKDQYSKLFLREYKYTIDALPADIRTKIFKQIHP